MSPAHHQNRRGILAMVIAMAVFTTNDTAMKLALREFPVGQAMLVRGLFALAITVTVVTASGHLDKLRLLLRPAVILRAGFEAVGAVMFFTCLKRLALADLVAITQATPLIIAAYCAATGIAPMGWRRWAAVLTGFAGVLLIVRPGGSGFDPFLGVAVLSATFVAGRDLATRQIASEIPSTVILVTTSVAVLAIGAALSATEEWVPLRPGPVGLLAFASVFVSLGHFFAIVAFRDVDVAVVSPFRYSVMVWAVLAGLLVFGEQPSAATLAGSTLIVGSGLYTIHRERLRAKAISGR